MKAGTRTILKWLLLSALAAYSVWASVWGAREAAQRVCKGIDIEVVDYRMPDSLLKAGLHDQLLKYPRPIVGARLNTINTNSIRHYLSSLRNFENVEVVITANGYLKVRVEPMVPVMRVFYGGKSYYVNKDGKQIESDAEFFTDVPVVSGNFNREFMPSEVLPVVRFIENDRMLTNLVAMIEARDRNNIMLVPRIAGHVINFGDTNRLNEKRKALELFYHKVTPYRGWEYYDTISVKYRGQVVASRKNKTILNHAEQYIEEVDMEEATLPEAPGNLTDVREDSIGSQPAGPVAE